MRGQLMRPFVLMLISYSVLFLSSNYVLAQTLSSDEQINEARRSAVENRVDLSQYIQSNTSTPQLNADPRLTGAAAQEAQLATQTPPPFGASLFNKTLEHSRSVSVNPDYIVSPGDKFSLQLWGAVAMAEILIVDNNGFLFIPGVGPLNLSNARAIDANQLIESHVKTVYTNNVNVYVSLITTTPVSVFVTGAVTRPGQYAGTSSDSIIYYLRQAGGIDDERGSYRSVNILRGGKSLLSYDLYEFLREGKLTSFSFKEGDVVLVSEQKSLVTVEGAARYPFKFELLESDSKGADLIRYSRPLAKTSHVAVTGNREKGPISVYMPIEAFGDFVIADGDTVLFNDDLRPQVISVQISGSYIGPSFYAVDINTKLMELLDYIEVDPSLADLNSIYIKRESVAEQQKKLLEESLQRMERSVFTAPASSEGDSRIRAQEAELVMRFVERARLIEPLGKVVLADAGQIANIRLEQGDEIIIPERTDLIHVSGEVLIPQAFVHKKQTSLSDYIGWAGGFTDRAETERIAIVQSNGLTRFVTGGSSQHWFSDSQPYELNAGDQILVLPKADTKVLQAVKDITQIIFQIAVAANVALD